MFTIKILMKDDTLVVIHKANMITTKLGITVNDKFHYKFTKIRKIEMELITLPSMRSSIEKYMRNE